MFLGYKNYLIKKINGDSAVFFRKAVEQYVDSLGIAADDFYEAWDILQRVEDDLYCGEGYNDKGKFFLYDEQGQLYWFRTYFDACIFAGVEEVGDNIFNQYHRHWFNGFLWLYLEDIYDLDEILDKSNQGVYCETKEIGFDSIDEAVRWLVDAGYAKSEGVAKKQLVKHLDGLTGLCYKMKFIKY